MAKSDLSRLSALLARDDVPDDARSLIASVVRSPLATDKFIYRTVVVVLGLTVLATVIGGVVIVVVGQGNQLIKLPGAVVAIGSAAVGALAGLLAPSPARRQGNNGA
jgi:hypothetical protein